MKELVVISGKGGTGKTSIVAAFAQLAENAVFADCDVDAADLHLILQPNVRQQSDFTGGKQARINTDLCTGCGKCMQVCRFDAISHNGPANNFADSTYTVEPLGCEGCGVCVKFCPANAIEFNDTVNGKWYISDTRFGTMVHARLGIAEENSGKLVTLIRNQARELAQQNNNDFVIVDGSPGIGCPVIASITGADLVLIVTEPTLSGQHDLQRVAQLAQSFKIPVVVAVNKYDLNPQMAKAIEHEAQKHNIKVAGKIRYDKSVTRAQVMKSTVLEYTASAVTTDIKSLWRNVNYALG